MPLSCLTTRLRKSSTVFRFVFATRFTDTMDPFVRPIAASALLFARASRTCEGERPSAAIRSGLSQIRIANVRLPRMSARWTPLIAVSFGWTTRVR